MLNAAPRPKRRRSSFETGDRPLQASRKRRRPARPCPQRRPHADVVLCCCAGASDAGRILLHPQHRPGHGSELCQKMLVSAGQTRNNIDNRFEQVKESASALIAHCIPISIQTRTQPCNWKNTPRYAARCLNSWTSICHAPAAVCARRKNLFRPEKQRFTPWTSCPAWEKTGPFIKKAAYYGTEQPCQPGHIRAHRRCFCAVALKSQADYDKLCGVLFADGGVSQFHEIFAAGSTNHDEMFLADAQGRFLAHTDDAHLGDNGPCRRR